MKVFRDRPPKQLFLTLLAGVAAILALWGGLISVGLLDPISKGTPQASPEQRQAVLGRWCATDENVIDRNSTLTFAGQGLDLTLTADLRVFTEVVDAPVKLFSESDSILFTIDQRPGSVYVADLTGDALALEIYRKQPASDFGTGEFLHRQFYRRCA